MVAQLRLFHYLKKSNSSGENVEGRTNTKSMFFSWWYGEGFRRLLILIVHLYKYLFDLFSVKISLQTLFAPWKRDEIGYENLSLQQQLQVWLLNLSSRFVGFWVKFFTILTCLILAGCFTVIAGLSTIFWLLCPLLIILFIVKGLSLIYGTYG